MEAIKKAKAKVEKMIDDDNSIDIKKFTFYRRKDKNIIDVDYEGKPLTFTFKDARESGILEGRNGKTKYIKFSIPYAGDNIKTFEEHKQCYAYICTVHYLEAFEKSESSLSDLIREGFIIDDPFRMYNKESITPNEEFSIYITIFDNTRIKGVDMKSIVNIPFICDLTLKLYSVTGASNDNPGRLNFQISEITLKRTIEKAEKIALEYDVNQAIELLNSLKIKK